VFYLLLFVIKNFGNFLTNTAVHGVNTRTKYQLHRPAVTLSCIQRGVFYSGIKIFNRQHLVFSNYKMRPQDSGWRWESIWTLMSFILLTSFYLAVKLLSLLNIRNDSIIIDVESLQ